MKLGRVVPALAFALVASFGVASANDLPKADAARAAKALEKGALVAEQTDEGTNIYIIRDLKSTESANGRMRLEVAAEALAVGKLDCCGNATYELVAPGKTRKIMINVAKAFVTSREVPGMMVNLGKKIGMRIKADMIAFELPTKVIRAAATRAQSSAKASAHREEPKEEAPASTRRAPIRVS